MQRSLCRGGAPNFALLSKTGVLKKVKGPAQPVWLLEFVEELAEMLFPDLLSSRTQREVLQGTIAA